MKKKNKQILYGVWICICISCLFSFSQVCGIAAGCINFIISKSQSASFKNMEFDRIILNALKEESAMTVFFMELVSFILIFAVAAYLYKDKLKRLFIVRHPIKAVYSVAAAVGVYFGILFLLNTIPWPQSWLAANQESTSIITDNGGSFILTWLSAGLFAPLSEEMAFRGIMVSLLRKRTGRWTAIILSSAAFGFIHGNILQGIYTGILGVVFCIINEKQHSITPGLAAHMATNTISLLLSAV